MKFNGKTEEESDEGNEPSQLIAVTQEPDLRTFGLCGDLDEEKTADILYTMLLLHENGKQEVPVNPKDLSKGTKTICEPFEFLISTAGGGAHEMFAIYDMMRSIRQDCTIKTLGMGKVMSAGVILLAAGTKGERRVGENCRIMIHSVIGGHAGAIHNLENEMDEVRWCQEQYIKALSRETDMTKAYIKKLLARKVNVYLTAAEAVELGIADKII